MTDKLAIAFVVILLAMIIAVLGIATLHIVLGWSQ